MDRENQEGREYVDPQNESSVLQNYNGPVPAHPCISMTSLEESKYQTQGNLVAGVLTGCRLSSMLANIDYRAYLRGI